MQLSSPEKNNNWGALQNLCLTEAGLHNHYVKKKSYPNVTPRFSGGDKKIFMHRVYPQAVDKPCFFTSKKGQKCLKTIFCPFSGDKFSFFCG
jgi:hypothetical protein